MLDADALAERVVGFDVGGKLALRVEGEGQVDAFAPGELFSEVAEDFGAGDGGLVGEDGVAVLVAEGLALQVEPAGVDGGVEAPVVEGEREIVARPGNLVGGGGFFEEAVGVGAVGALEVFEFDDGYARAGGRTERGGVVDLGSAGWRGELGVGGGGRGEKRGGGKGQEQAGAIGDGMGVAKETKHGDWTAPYGQL